MAGLDKAPLVVVDLSHLPKDLEAVVGPELTQSIVKHLQLANMPILAGKFDFGKWGYIRGDADFIKALKPMIKGALKE